MPPYNRETAKPSVLRTAQRIEGGSPDAPSAPFRRLAGVSRPRKWCRWTAAVQPPGASSAWTFPRRCCQAPPRARRRTPSRTRPKAPPALPRMHRKHVQTEGSLPFSLLPTLLQNRRVMRRTQAPAPCPPSMRRTQARAARARALPASKNGCRRHSSGSPSRQNTPVPAGSCASSPPYTRPVVRRLRTGPA